jgi:hypothetical protein
MAKQLKLRRGTTAQHSTFTGASGEVTVDTNKNTLVVHDGVTAGGKPLVVNGGLESVGIGCTPDSTFNLDIQNPSTAISAKTNIRIKSNAVSGDGDAQLWFDSADTGEAGIAFLNNGEYTSYLQVVNGDNYVLLSNEVSGADLYILTAASSINDGYAFRFQRDTGEAVISGVTGTITASAAETTITGLSTTTGLYKGMYLTKTAGTGAFGTSAMIKYIDAGTSTITVECASDGSTMTAGSITFTATPNPTTVHIYSNSSGTWTSGQDFARLAFGNVDTSGAGDGGIKASINAYVADTAATTAGMDFYVSSNGTTLTKAVRLDEVGNWLVGKSSNTSTVNGCELLQSGVGVFTSSGAANAVLINRLTDDGTLISFRQANTQEGSISVSGTTVSYNGGHLARWAQTTTAKDESLVKGTVLSNLDEMNVYTDAEGNPVENEQLNKVKVSDVEGDANVAGVFVNWTYDEQHSIDEINMAMTGDMIIRIAQGVTVTRGDLLMSAGDGTAKPQGDDIVRAKTIAKVTSTHVTCTYADGSFCVPCVLMAC